MGARIKVIIPSSSIEFRDSQIEERKQAAAPGNQMEVICLAHGPISIDAAYDEALAAPHIVEEVRKAEKEGFDGVSLHCAMDTVVRASREAVEIPATSAGEASYLFTFRQGDIIGERRTRSCRRCSNSNWEKRGISWLMKCVGSRRESPSS